MDSRMLDSICRQVYQRFPVVDGTRPTSQAQGSNTLLAFRGNQRAEDGKVINITIRVVVDPAGKIIKISTSR